MLNYNGQPCPGCGKHMHEGDDIVVCPVCATPQHRECWNEEGHCVNQALHSPDFVWKPRETETLNEPAESDNRICPVCSAENPASSHYCENCGASFPEEEDNSENICPFCGEKNPPSNKLCSNCGAPLKIEKSFFWENIYMSGVTLPEDEAIGNTTVGEAVYFIQSSPRKYINKFKKISSGSIISFNWAAFLFSPWWFFFRKLYKTGVLLLVLFTSITMMTVRFSAQIYSASVDMESRIAEIQEMSKEKTQDEIIEMQNKAIDEFAKKVKKPGIIMSAIVLAEHLICGFIADLVYYKRLEKIIEKVKTMSENDTMRKSLLIRAGGVSFISLAIGFFGNELFTQLLMTVANKISGMV